MITIKIPATSANVGPGFDCLGLAVSLYNTVKVEPSDTLKIEIEGEGAHSIPKNGTNLVFKAYRRTMQHLEAPIVNLHMIQHNQIPSTRGLGSSSTAIVAGILIASEISGKAVPLETALCIATEIEGHPDNVAPALYGGFTVSMQKEKQVRTMSFKVPDTLVPVAMVPDFELSTAKARNVLPQHVPLKDAVFNTAHASFLAACFAKGDMEHLLFAVEDRLHQPYRANLIPGFDEIVACGREVGIPVYLSGAGPTVMALCNRHNAKQFIEQAKPVLARHGNWNVYELEVENKGACVVGK